MGPQQLVEFTVNGPGSVARYGPALPIARRERYQSRGANATNRGPPTPSSAASPELEARWRGYAPGRDSWSGAADPSGMSPGVTAECQHSSWIAAALARTTSQALQFTDRRAGVEARDAACRSGSGSRPARPPWHHQAENVVKAPHLTSVTGPPAEQRLGVVGHRCGGAHSQRPVASIATSRSTSATCTGLILVRASPGSNHSARSTSGNSAGPPDRGGHLI